MTREVDFTPVESGLASGRHQTLCCDIFCAVIDNFGDAGFCWRLARQLASEQGWLVRLWIDRPDILTRLQQAAEVATTSTPSHRVRVRKWRVGENHFCASDGIPDVVIEAFACRLPQAAVKRMAQRTATPVWINLEYLSAEEWTERCHTLPSPDPHSGLKKYFFFPGFSGNGGGVLRESWVSNLVAEFDEKEVQRRFLASLGVTVSPGTLPLSLFTYAGSAIGALIDAWRESLPKVHCLASQELAPDLLRELHLGAASGAFELDVLPFLPQDDYDRLLLSTELNFVRGEDSFVRAQWAMRPFVWQAYRQEGNAQHAKVKAFLGKYLHDASPEVASTCTRLFLAWNGIGMMDTTTWQDFLYQREDLARHNRAWSSRLQRNGDLAANLAAFCNSRL